VPRRQGRREKEIKRPCLANVSNKLGQHLPEKKKTAKIRLGTGRINLFRQTNISNKLGLFACEHGVRD
jgi:hypothetical protein